MRLARIQRWRTLLVTFVCCAVLEPGVTVISELISVDLSAKNRKTIQKLRAQWRWLLVKNGKLH